MPKILLTNFSSLSKRGESRRSAAQSVSQVSFVQQSRSRQEKLPISKSQDKSNIATRICFSAAAAVRSAISLGRCREILPRLTVIGRMVVIDLGVNVCTSSHHRPTIHPPIIPRELFPPPANSAATPLPEESPGLHRGISAASPRQKSPVFPLLPILEGCRQPCSGATRPQPLQMRCTAFWQQQKRLHRSKDDIIKL